MTVNINTGFADGDRLLDIRESFLNPLAVKVAGMDTSVGGIDSRTKEAFVKVEPDVPGKQLTFTKDKGTKVSVSLDGMFKESSSITVEDGKGGSVKDPTSIKFADSTVTGAAGVAEVTYPWDQLVPTNQEFLSVGKTGVTATHKPKALYFKGKDLEVEHDGIFTTVTIPDQTPPLKAQINDTDIQNIETVKLTGNATGSTLANGTLTIKLPDSGGSLSNQNFKGFFSSLGDLESEVSDAINGRSYAFVKDNLIGGEYYTPYFYVNSGWTELKQDPALTYFAPSASANQGVFSIKPDPRIIIDKDGQLDLTGLSMDEGKLHFHGFYDTIAQLSAAVPNPTENLSFAYTKHTNGAWIGRQWRRNPTGDLIWGIMAPLGAISLVDSPGSSAIPAPVYGFYRNEMVEIDSNGLMTIKGEADATIHTSISHYNDSVDKGDINSIELKKGSSFASIQDKKLVLENPQRVIDYNATWESQHNQLDYMGNIFYDKTSRCWMGWAEPEAPGAVGHKWTRIAHEGMGDEVKSLSYRFPRFIPEVSPGPLGDVRNWEFSSWTFLEADSIDLPEPIRDIGGYVTTFVRKTQDEVGAPSKRIQQCIADNETGDTFVRKYNPNASVGESVWHKWVKTSMSQLDIDAHNNNPGAHKKEHRFYKVCTLDMAYSVLKAGAYALVERDMMILADSHGTTSEGKDRTTIPYNGTFNITGRFVFDGWTGTAIDSSWVLKVARVRKGVSAIIGEFTYRNAQTPKAHMPPVQWAMSSVQLEAGDTIAYSLKCLDDTNFKTNYPTLALVPMRSYFVVEDDQTSAGSRIAETHRKTTGALFTRNNTGINVHYASGTSGTIRMYSAAINPDYKPMAKV